MLCGISITDNNWGWCYLHVWMLLYRCILVHSAISFRFEHCITSENDDRYAPNYTLFFFFFQQTMICLFFALAAWIRRQQCQSDGLPTTLQTELSIWWIAMKLCRDIHGFHWPFCSDFGDPLIWRPIGLTSLGQTEMSHVVQCVCPRRFHLVPLTSQNCCALLISKC